MCSALMTVATKWFNKTKKNLKIILRLIGHIYRKIRDHDLFALLYLRSLWMEYFSNIQHVYNALSWELRIIFYCLLPTAFSSVRFQCGWSLSIDTEINNIREWDGGLYLGCSTYRMLFCIHKSDILVLCLCFISKYFSRQLLEKPQILLGDTVCVCHSCVSLKQVVQRGVWPFFSRADDDRLVWFLANENMMNSESKVYKSSHFLFMRWTSFLLQEVLPQDPITLNN